MPAVKNKTKPAITRMLDAREVAAHFGISVGTVYRMMRAGEFPKPVRLGRRLVRWDVTTLNQWIAGGCRPLQ